MKLQGTYTALITPFDTSGENVDYAAFKKIIQFQIDNQVQGIVPCGTTGESPTLSHKEHTTIIDKAVEWTKQISPSTAVIAGAGSNSTKEAVELSRSAKSSGADYVLSVNPYYNKPNQEGLIKHFLTIADSVDIPIILYNIPGRTNVTISLESMAKLAQHPNIVGVKEATGDINFSSNIIAMTQNENFTVLSGDDNMILPILSVGGKGVISVASNIYPKQISNIISSYFSKNIQESQDMFLKMLPFFSLLFVETNPIPVKYIGMLKQLCNNSLRLPLVPLAKQYENQIQKMIQHIESSI